MRVKIGNEWHEARPGCPIAVELTESDKSNIAGMLPTARRYAVFSDRDSASIDDKRAWVAA